MSADYINNRHQMAPEEWMHLREYQLRKHYRSADSAHNEMNGSTPKRNASARTGSSDEEEHAQLREEIEGTAMPLPEHEKSERGSGTPLFADENPFADLDEENPVS